MKAGDSHMAVLATGSRSYSDGTIYYLASAITSASYGDIDLKAGTIASLNSLDPMDVKLVRNNLAFTCDLRHKVFKGRKSSAGTWCRAGGGISSGSSPYPRARGQPTSSPWGCGRASTPAWPGRLQP